MKIVCVIWARACCGARTGDVQEEQTHRIKENRTHNSPLQFIHSLFAHARRCTSVARHATRRSLSSLSHKSIRSPALPPKVAHAARRAPPHSRVAPAFGERERAHTYHLHSALAMNLPAMIFRRSSSIRWWPLPSRLGVAQERVEYRQLNLLRRAPVPRPAEPKPHHKGLAKLGEPRDRRAIHAAEHELCDVP